MRNRIYFIPPFSLLIPSSQPSKGISAPRPCPDLRGRPEPHIRVGPIRGQPDGIPDTFLAIRPAGAPAFGDRGRRLVRLHQSREPLPQSRLPTRRRAHRVLPPRDDRYLPLPARRDHRVGDAPAADFRWPRAMPGMRAMDRRSIARWPRGPPPDRADPEAVLERNRLRRRPAKGRRCGAVRDPDASRRKGERADPRDADSWEPDRAGSARGTPRPGLRRAVASQSATAARPRPQALRFPRAERIGEGLSPRPCYPSPGGRPRPN